MARKKKINLTPEEELEQVLSEIDQTKDTLKALEKTRKKLILPKNFVRQAFGETYTKTKQRYKGKAGRGITCPSAFFFSALFRQISRAVLPSSAHLSAADI